MDEHAILCVGEGTKRIFWQAWGNRPPELAILVKEQMML